MLKWLISFLPCLIIATHASSSFDINLKLQAHIPSFLINKIRVLVMPCMLSYPEIVVSHILKYKKMFSKNVEGYRAMLKNTETRCRDGMQCAGIVGRLWKDYTSITQLPDKQWGKPNLGVNLQKCLSPYTSLGKVSSQSWYSHHLNINTVAIA